MTESPSPVTSSTGALDWLGVGASMTCAVHCAVVPLLALALPALSASWLFSDQVAHWMIAGSTAVALLSLGSGFRLHAHAGPVILAGLGLGLLVAGELVEGDLIRGVVLAFAGGLLLAGAHLFNRSLCLVCPACSTENAANSGPCRLEE
jgi:hypothetical protein